jgi:hypothetical protein
MPVTSRRVLSDLGLARAGVRPVQIQAPVPNVVDPLGAVEYQEVGDRLLHVPRSAHTRLAVANALEL